MRATEHTQRSRFDGLGIAATFAITLLFAFIASLRAARLDPVVALRHE